MLCYQTNCSLWIPSFSQALAQLTARFQFLGSWQQVLSSYSKRDHDIIPSSSCNWKKDISNTFLKWDWFHSLTARITLCHWVSEIERLLNPSHSFFYHTLSLIILILPPIFWHLNTYFFNWQLLCLQKNHYLPTRANVICFCTFILAFFFKQTKKVFQECKNWSVSKGHFCKNNLFRIFLYIFRHFSKAISKCKICVSLFFLLSGYHWTSLTFFKLESLKQLLTKPNELKKFMRIVQV